MLCFRVHLGDCLTLPLSVPVTEGLPGIVWLPGRDSPAPTGLRKRGCWPPSCDGTEVSTCVNDHSPVPSLEAGHCISRAVETPECRGRALWHHPRRILHCQKAYSNTTSLRVMDFMCEFMANVWNISYSCCNRLLWAFVLSPAQEEQTHLCRGL